MGTLLTPREIAVAVSRHCLYTDDNMYGSRTPFLHSSSPSTMACSLPISDKPDKRCVDCWSACRHTYTLIQKSITHSLLYIHAENVHHQKNAFFVVLFNRQIVLEEGFNAKHQQIHDMSGIVGLTWSPPHLSQRAHKLPFAYEARMRMSKSGHHMSD